MSLAMFCIFLTFKKCHQKSQTNTECLLITETVCISKLDKSHSSEPQTITGTQNVDKSTTENSP